MTPAELIARRLKAAIENRGTTVPVVSLLLAALTGDRLESLSSCIALNVHIESQTHEPLPLYSFSATATLTVSVDDDRSGGLFATNYEALWNAFADLSQGDNCTAIGDEGDTPPGSVFAVDGFQITSGSEPSYQEDDNGGSWTTSFAATITGRLY